MGHRHHGSVLVRHGLEPPPFGGTMQNNTKSQVDGLVRFLFAPVDNASVTFFRIAWGVIAATWAWSYLTEGKVTSIYVKPEFHFTYWGFGWVHPWPGNGMYWHFWLLLLLALAIAVGFFYRIATFIFALAFSYVFLLEQTNYQNHYYLMLLLSWTLCVLPLHRGLSWDSRHLEGVAADSCPRWVLNCLQLHVAIPYFYGGVAKLVPDWMLGQPLGMMLATQADLPILGSYLDSPNAGVWMSWGGLLFDLLIVPALLWKRSRLAAFMACVVFHLCNSVIFNIHIFPWFMIAATTLFFAPDWPRRLLGGAPIALPKIQTLGWDDLARWQRVLCLLAVIYLGFHLTWPVRHRLYAGDSSWTERGHFFSWRMMLRGKTGGVRYFVTDPSAGRTFSPDHRKLLSPEQAGKFPRNPDWILQLAHHLDAKYQAELGADVAVHAMVLLSLNGRKPQLMIDPNADLSQIQRGPGSRPWVLPLEEPLRKYPWDVPLEEWEQYVELPQLEFIEPPSEADDQSQSRSQPTS